jgi:hypothetical protein
MLMKLWKAVILDAVDHQVHEPFAGRINDSKTRVLGDQLTTDGMHQVGLPHAHAAVDKQRIITASRRGRDRPSGCMSELVARPDHEAVERKLPVEVGSRGPETILISNIETSRYRRSTTIDSGLGA